MNNKVVYILEDDPDISELISYILSEDGYKVVLYPTVRQFQTVIAQSLPDIFILDVLLPDGNGLDICKQLRTNEITAGIPVLIMSANKTKMDMEAVGCHAEFISKPFNIDDLLSKVGQYV